MRVQSINPATEELLAEFDLHSDAFVEQALTSAAAEFRTWRATSFAERADRMKAAARYLRVHRAKLSALITAEMGKPITQAEAEIDICAACCDFYADCAEALLANDPRQSNGRTAYVAYRPLGPIFGIMPWNYPFWQVFRFAVPALMGGNVVLVKHASNVPQTAEAIERVFREAGFPTGAFQNLRISSSVATALITDRRIAAVTLTGSAAAGKVVAAAAGAALKKVVLELGGSDPFIVLDDADLDQAAQVGAWARNQNAGQTCIAAKRFIVVDAVADAFTERLVAAVAALKVGDPSDPDTQVGPLAHPQVVRELDDQVRRSIAAGAVPALGARRPQRRGYYYEPTVLTGVTPQMPVGCEETFGPVAAVIRVRDEQEAVAVANASDYGLGASIWTADEARGERLAGLIEAGAVFINGKVSADLRLPFGGVKHSGYGRELSEFGLREFQNVQTVWIGPVQDRI